jgi:hypothetical protein
LCLKLTARCAPPKIIFPVKLAGKWVKRESKSIYHRL